MDSRLDTIFKISPVSWGNFL